MQLELLVLPFFHSQLTKGRDSGSAQSDGLGLNGVIGLGFSV